MAKVYILTEADFEKLRLMVDRNPKHGTRGGSSAALNAKDEEAHKRAHRFYNYQVCTWIEEVKK